MKQDLRSREVEVLSRFEGISIGLGLRLMSRQGQSVEVASNNKLIELATFLLPFPCSNCLGRSSVLQGSCSTWTAGELACLLHRHDCSGTLSAC